MRHLTLVPDLPDEPFDPQPDVRWLTNPTGDKYGNGAERVPTFTLGVDNASPLEMANGYATFANNGDTLMHRVWHDLCRDLDITLTDDSDGVDFIAVPPPRSRG